MELPLPVKAVDLALSTIAPYRRPDLEGRLQQTRARLLDDRIRVLVVGEFKQGKSMLVNALVSAPVCPVVRRRRDVGAHRRAVRRRAQPHRGAARRGPGRRRPVEQRAVRTDVPSPSWPTRSPGTSRSRSTPATGERLRHVEVGLPRGTCCRPGWRSSTPPASAG